MDVIWHFDKGWTKPAAGLMKKLVGSGCAPASDHDAYVLPTGKGGQFFPVLFVSVGVSDGKPDTFRPDLPDTLLHCR
jgi:hypothetical protein